MIKRLFSLVALFAVLGTGPAIADDVISNGLTLTLPSAGSTNWADTFHDNFAVPISGHDHTGGGKGVQIGTNAIASNAVNQSKIRLANDGYLRARNAANSGDIEICKVSAADKIRFNGSNVSSDTRADLGLAIGTNVQAYDEELADVAGLTPTDNNFIVGNGSAFVTESGSTARTSMGVGTGDSPTFTGATISGLTANSLVATDGSKALTSSVSGLSPTLTGLGLSSLSASSFVYTDGSKNLSTTASTGPSTTSWTPTISAISGTNNGGTLQEARYVQIGPLVFFWVHFSAFSVLTGAPSALTVTPPPIAGVAMSGYFPTGAIMASSGSVSEPGFWTYNGTTFTVVQGDGGQFTNPGSAYTVSFQGFYRVL